jgi:hypothetical protein
MYRIIGADQKEYGPVTLEQLRQWMAEGRVNGQTQVSVNGGAWQLLGTLPEFAGLAVPPLAAALPVADGAQVARRALRIPAILLIVTGALSLLGSVAGLLRGPGRLPSELMGNVPPAHAARHGTNDGSIVQSDGLCGFDSVGAAGVDGRHLHVATAVVAAGGDWQHPGHHHVQSVLLPPRAGGRHLGPDRAAASGREVFLQMIPPRLATCPPEAAARFVGPARTGLAVLLLAALAVLYCFDPSGHAFYPRCAFKAWSGLDCPGCGGLRAGHALLHCDIALALSLNPLVVLLATAVLAWGVVRFTCGARAGAAVADRLTRPRMLGIAGALLILFTLARNLARFTPMAGL